MQRYLVWLVMCWVLHLLVFEPLLFVGHIILGEPGIDTGLWYAEKLGHLLSSRCLRCWRAACRCCCKRNSLAVVAMAPSDTAVALDS